MARHYEWIIVCLNIFRNVHTTIRACIYGMRLSHIYVSIFFLFWSYLFFTLGYSDFEVKQTCQRCELDVSKKDGIYNLIVQNVRLGEDEYYECQVSPGKTSINSLPLRAPVHLTIQGKMKSVKCNYN